LVVDPKTPMNFGSPDLEYFRMPASAARSHTSRWKEDWEELELLVRLSPSPSPVLMLCCIQGKGAFGSVVKARNKIDSRIYAGLSYPSSHPSSISNLFPVKKIRLRTMQSDSKIFREVNALSRLSHRFIVRYYTTWVETAEPTSTAASDDSSAESTDEDGMTSVPHPVSNGDRHLRINGGFSINIEDFDDLSESGSSFPSIHFDRSTSPTGEDTSSGEEGDDDFGSLFKSSGSSNMVQVGPPMLSRTLYIQMVGVSSLLFHPRLNSF
jgi:translation initiation factor 2-alpha kinase 4